MLMGGMTACCTYRSTPTAIDCPPDEGTRLSWFANLCFLILNLEPATAF